MAIDPATLKDWIFPIIEAGAAVATMILLIFVWKQMKQTDSQLEMTKDDLAMTRQQIESSLRPWVGAGAGGLTVFAADKLRFVYQNYGQLPTISTTITSARSTTLFERNLLRTADASAPLYVGIIYPEQQKTFFINIEAAVLEAAKQGQQQLFIGILLTYAYGNGRSGEYGTVAEFDRQSTSFFIRDEWTTNG